MHQTQSQTMIHANWLTPTLRNLSNTHSDLLHARGFRMDRPQTWYDLESWLHVLNDLAAKGIPLDAIGETMANSYPFSNVGTVTDALVQLGEDFLKAHKQAADTWQVQPQTPQMVCLCTRTPYPDEFELGLIRGVAERFAGTSVMVQQFHSMPRLVAYNNRTYLMNW